MEKRLRGEVGLGGEGGGELNKILKPALELHGCVYRLSSVSISLIGEHPRCPPHERIDPLPRASGRGMMMMIAQKPPIRGGRPRIIIYDFDEDVFEEANMPMDDADGMDIIQIKLFNSPGHCFHIQHNMRKRSGERYFFLVGHAGLLDVEGLLFEAEGEKEEALAAL